MNEDDIKQDVGLPLAGDDGLDNDLDDPMDRELEAELERTHPVITDMPVPPSEMSPQNEQDQGNNMREENYEGKDHIP